MKTANDVYKENGFTSDMALPNHLVMMLMRKYASEVAVAFAEWVGQYGYKKVRHTDDESKAGKWYSGHSSLLAKTTFYTAPELFEKFKSENK